MPTASHIIATSRIADRAVRVLLTFPFWGSGLDKLLNFGGALATMSRFGLEPAPLFAIGSIAVLLGGSALVVADRRAWLGALALALFTALTIPIVHRFWALDGEAALTAFHFAAEHVGMIGGLLLVAMLSLGRPRVQFVTVSFPPPRQDPGARDGALLRLRGSKMRRHACP